MAREQMIATYVPPVRTPVSREAIVRAFLWALPAGTKPEGVALGLAQWALETGRGESMYNWCPGNAKAGERYEGNFTARRCNEKLNGAWRYFLPEGECNSRWELIVWANGQAIARHSVPPGHPQTRFRAYANIWDGTLEHVGLLAKRFGAAWPALLEGHAPEFVAQLAAHGYFTADAEPYLKGVASLQREFLRVLADERDVPEEPVDRGLVGLLALSDAFLVEDSRDIDFTPSDAVADTPRT